VADPVSIMVDTFGTGKVSNARLEELIRRHFDFTPAGIIKYLNLRRPIYKKTAAYGHFGRPEPDFTWERTDRVKDLRDDARVQLGGGLCPPSDGRRTPRGVLRPAPPQHRIAPAKPAVQARQIESGWRSTKGQGRAWLGT